jgi:hypothetical protein
MVLAGRKLTQLDLSIAHAITDHQNDIANTVR